MIPPKRRPLRVLRSVPHSPTFTFPQHFDGGICFSEPGFPTPGMDLDYNRVYQVDPDLGTITLISWDFARPRGLGFSADESIPYIDDTCGRHIRPFNMVPYRMPLVATGRDFVT